MKFHVIKQCRTPPQPSCQISADRMRFFIRKTLKYGSLVRMKYEASYRFVYYSCFALGFSCYVVVHTPSRELTIPNVVAVIIKNERAQSVWE